MTDPESISTSVKFSRDQFRALAAKLGEISLDPDERELLLVIFAAARDHVSVVAPVEGSNKQAVTSADPTGATPPDPAQQIVDAFIPDDVYVIQEGPSTSKITPAEIHPPRHLPKTTTS